MPSLTRTPVLELADSLRRREVSATELLDACLEEVDRLNGDLNAVVWRDDEAARAAAAEADRRLANGGDAPFLGVPMPIKDLTEVQGWPISYGSRGRDESPWEGPTELCVDALARAGFVLACKTNTPEFGHITVAENLRFGPTRNPSNRDRSPGGLSGGAGAATASGMFPAAHANDGGGSIRIPASCCGLVGLKPSRGRVPRLNESWRGAVVEGAVTRTVADSAAILDAIAGPDSRSWYNAPGPERPFLEEVGADEQAAGGALRARLRRATHADDGDHAAARGRGARGVAREARGAGRRGRGDGGVLCLRQRHRPARHLAADPLDGRRPAGRRAAHGRPVAGGHDPPAGGRARAGPAVGRPRAGSRAGLTRVAGRSARQGGGLPRAPRGRAVRDPQPLGRRHREGARRTGLQGARHHELRVRVHPRSSRRGGDARRGDRPHTRARPRHRPPCLGRPGERLRAGAAGRREGDRAGGGGRCGWRVD